MMHAARSLSSSLSPWLFLFIISQLHPILASEWKAWTQWGSTVRPGTARHAVAKMPQSILESWLQALVVQIPDIDFTLDNGAQGSLQGFTCRNFSVASINASNSETLMNVSFEGVAAACDGSWVAQYGLLHGSGGVSGQVSNGGVSAGLAIDVGSGPSISCPNLPWIVQKVHLDSCQVNAEVPDLKFTGGLSFILNAFSNVIAGLLQKQITMQVCTAVSPLVDKNLTDLVLEGEKQLEIVAEYQDAEIEEMHCTNKSFGWNEIWMLGPINRVIKDIVSKGCFSDIMAAVLDCRESCTVHLPNASHTASIVMYSPLANVTIAMLDTQLQGLETVSTVEVLEPINNHSLRLGLGFQSLQIDLGLSVTVAPLGMDVSGQVLAETFKVKTSISNSMVSFDVQACVERELTEALFVEQVTKAPCISKAMNCLNLTKIEANFTLDGVQITGTSGGVIEAELDHLLNTISNLILGQMHQTVEHLVRHFLSSQLKDFLNVQLDEWLSRARSMECTEPVVPSPNSMLLLNSSYLLTLIDHLFEKKTTAKKVDDFFGCYFGRTQTPKTMASTLLSSKQIGFPAFNHFEITGLDTFKTFVPLHIKEDGHTILTHINLTQLDISAGVSVPEGKGFGSNLDGSIGLQSTDIMAETEILLNVSMLSELKVSQLENFDCVLGLFASSSLSRLEISGIEAVVQVNKKRFQIEQYGPKYRGPGDIPLYAEINKRSKPLLERAMQSCLGNLERKTTRAAMSVGHIILWCGVAFVALITFAIMSFQSYEGHVLKKSSISPSSSGSSSNSVSQNDEALQEPLLPQKFELEETNIKEKNTKNGMKWHHKGFQEHGSLFTSARLPLVIRLALPIVLVLNISMFLYSNTSIGASVEMSIFVGEERIKLPSVFDFSLVNTVEHMWNAKVYFLAIIIAVFSGIWPYIKLLITLFCWFLKPKSKRAAGRRAAALGWVAALGKWSLVDAYVLVVMVVAFRFRLVPLVPDPGAAAAATGAAGSAGAAGLDVVVVPGPGFHCFLAATVLSLAVSHVISGCLHYLEPIWSNEPDCNTSPIQSRRVVLYKRPFILGNKRFYRFTYRGRMLVVLALGCAFVLLVIGSSLPAVNILFEGLAGKLLGGSSSRHYSALSLGEDLPSNTLHPNGVGIRWIQSIYFMFTFAMPSVFLLSSMLVWIIPMSHSAVNRAHQFLEIVGAWTATDVLLLSVLATVLEISIFADFMVGDDCDFINSVLSQYQMDLGLTDAVCFSLRVKEQRGAWVILCHVILTYLSGAVVNAVAQCGCHQYFNADKFTPVDGQLMQAKHYKQQLVQPPVLSSVNNSSEWYSCEEDRGGDGIFPRHAHNQEPRVLHDPLVQKDKHQTEKGILEEASISCGSNTESHHREINPLFWMMILISKKYLGLLEELHYCTEEPDKGVDNHGGAYVAGDNN